MADEPKGSQNLSRAQDLSSVKNSTGAVDYYSVLTNVIQMMMKDPAQMRGLVYEMARITLRREAWNKFPPLRGDALKTHLNTLEDAIARVELDAQAKALAERQAPPRVAYEKDEVKSREVVPLSERPSLAETTRVFNVREAPRTVWAQSDTPASGRRSGFNLVAMLQLVVASFIGVAMFAFLTGQVEIGGWSKRKAELKVEAAAPAEPAQAQAAAEPAAAPVAVASAPPPPPFPLPQSYGVYVVNDGQLVELERMTLRVPDPRVYFSPDIATPSRITLSNGKPTFVVFRRELANGAPEKVPVRVIARIVRETTFKNGKPVTANVDAIWRIRNNAHDLKVGPIADQREMISIAPEADFEIPPGRYALVINGVGYDFNVAGAITATEQCLERMQSVNGDVFTECKK
ncbi:MAG: hypothetical protein AB1490_08010 [Pseudomonadota bacterium]